MEVSFADKECSDAQYDLLKGFVLEMGQKSASGGFSDEEKRANAEILASRGGAPIAPAEFEAIFEAEDRNKDGLLDESEFFASQTASFAFQQSYGLKVVFPTAEESAPARNGLRRRRTTRAVREPGRVDAAGP